MLFVKKKLSTNSKTQLLTTSRHLVFGMLLVIFVGSLLFVLPISYKVQQLGGKMKYIDALFLATSATCVTGLSSIDVSSQLTIFGQIVLMLLIQIGGLGFMTFTSVLYLYFLNKFSLSSLVTIKDDIKAGSRQNSKRYIKGILIWNFAVEGIGFLFLLPAFSIGHTLSGGKVFWNALFTSVSAFCNAGFSIYDADSLINLNGNSLLLIVVAVLIILGGIGFLVVSDIWNSKNWSKFKLHTQVVILVTGFLLVGGTIWIFASEYSNAFDGMSFGKKLVNAFFLSTTARTAGFANVDMSTLRQGTSSLISFLMFVGASPSSTGGGIKTTTLFILMINVFIVIRQKKRAVINRQSIGGDAFKKASVILIMAILVFAVSIGILSYSNGDLGHQELMFEQISAYSTTGLSMGITHKLSVMSKLVLILCMFIGRVGVITFLLSIARTKNVGDSKIKYRESTIQV